MRSPGVARYASPVFGISLGTHAFIALLLTSLVAIAYAPILGVPFLSDDYGIIAKVVLPDGGTDWSRVLGDFRGPLFGYRAMYRPLYTLSFALDYSLFGSWALPYHLTNIVLHAFTSFFVYLITLELVRSAWRWGAAVLAGTLFALYPIHPESVTWIAGRVDVICAAFFLPAMFFFLRWLRAERNLYLVLSLASFALSLMSKEMAVTLPGLLFLIALYAGKGLRGAVLRMLPFAIMLGAYLLFRYYILGEIETNQILERETSTVAILEGFVYRTLHMFVPINLGLLPGGLRRFLDVAFSWPLLVAILFFLVWAKSKLPLLLFALYTLSLVPVLPALARMDPLLSTSRWFYIPSVFLSIFVACLVWGAVNARRRWRLPVVAALCATFLAMLLANNWVWAQAGELAEEMLRERKTPEFPVKYKGAHVFLNEPLWHRAHEPPFRKPEDALLLRTAGTVGVVNSEEGRLSLKRKSGERVAISFDPEITEVSADGKEAELKDIKTGQQIRVTYAEGYESDVAHSIEIRDDKSSD